MPKAAGGAGPKMDFKEMKSEPKIPAVDFKELKGTMDQWIKISGLMLNRN